jgi:YolD-like protein
VDEFDATGPCKRIKTVHNEEYYDVTGPNIDEQQLEEMNELVLEAMEYNFPLTFIIYKNRKLVVINGHIHYIDSIKMEFRIVDLDHFLHKVSFSKVKAIHKYVKKQWTLEIPLLLFDRLY